MKTKLNGFLTLLLAFAMQITFAQEKAISGTVSDDNGPLPGVSVLKKGTKQGVETDFDGNYKINAKTGDVLIFSFVGMQTIEKTVGASSKIDVKLTMSSENSLEEIVIIGYGNSKKSSLTGSTKQVKATVIESKATSDVTKALAGEVSGVRVVNSSGQPGSSAKVRIRGFGSIDGLNSPLYVIDGVPYEGNTNAINQSDIESFTVLKDASATAIYGSRGSNGVIVITTKQGKKGKFLIELESKTGTTMELLPRYDILTSPEEYTEISWDILKGFFKGNIDGVTDEQAGKYASEYLFSDDTNNGKIPMFYNVWNQSGSDLIDPATGKIRTNATKRYTPENWNDYLFDNGIRTENTLKLSGGNDKTRFYSSIGYLDDNGYAKKTNFNRITTRLNVSHEIKPWLKGTINTSFITAKSRGAAGLGARYSTNSFYFAKNIPTIYPVFERDAEGNKIEEPYFGGYLYDAGSGENRKDRPFGNDSSPLISINYDLSQTRNYRFVGNQYLEAKPIKELTLSSRVGLEYVSSNGLTRINPFYGGGVNQNGTIAKSNTQVRFYTWTKMLKYEKEFDIHKISALAAHENSSYQYKYMYAKKSNLVNPFGNDFDNAVKDEGLASSYTRNYLIESYFGQLNYEYDEKYIGSLTFRRDGSSKFSRDKWDNFGAIGLAWRISKENFMLDSDIFKELKLRTSFGITGNQGTANKTSKIRFFYANQEFFEGKNSGGEPALSFYLKGNPNLTWERAKMFEIGTDFNIADIVEGTLNYYTRDTQNMFYNRRGGIALGYAFIKVNDGKMRNSGFEFDLKTHIINTNDLKLDFILNGEMVKNKITAMPIDSGTGKQKVLNDQLSTGHSYYEYYMPEWKGVNKETGAAQWASYYDDKNNNDIRDAGETIKSMTLYLADNKKTNIKKDVTEVYSEATRKYIDNKLKVSTVRGAFGLNAEYKGISFSTQFLYGLGGYIYDSEYANYMSDGNVGASNYHVDVRNRWKKSGDNTDIPRFRGGADNNATSSSTRFLTKRDYLTLNNIKVGYTLPKNYLESLKLDNVSLYVSGDNLWIASHRKGLNPSAEVSDITYNPLSTLTLGLNVKF